MRGMNRSPEWVNEYMAKRIQQGGPQFPILDGLADEGPESALQSKIVTWAKDWGHPCLSFPRTQKVKRFLPAGWPDIVLLLNNKVLFLELKSGKKDLAEDQKKMKLQFMAHGHEIHKVRSYKRFIGIVEGLYD